MATKRTLQRGKKTKAQGANEFEEVVLDAPRKKKSAPKPQLKKKRAVKAGSASGKTKKGPRHVPTAKLNRKPRLSDFRWGIQRKGKLWDGVTEGFYASRDPMKKFVGFPPDFVSDPRIGDLMPHVGKPGDTVSKGVTVADLLVMKRVKSYDRFAAFEGETAWKADRRKLIKYFPELTDEVPDLKPVEYYLLLTLQNTMQLTAVSCGEDGKSPVDFDPALAKEHAAEEDVAEE